MHNNYFPEYIFNNNFNKNDTKEAKTKTQDCQMATKNFVQYSNYSIFIWLSHKFYTVFFSFFRDSCFIGMLCIDRMSSNGHAVIG